MHPYHGQNPKQTPVYLYPEQPSLPRDRKYSTLKQQISNEKMKSLMAARLLKKSTSQALLPPSVAMNRSGEGKSRVEEESQCRLPVGIRGRCVSREDLRKPKKQVSYQWVQLPSETKQYPFGQSELQYQPQVEDQSRRMKIYNQPLFQYPGNDSSNSPFSNQVENLQAQFNIKAFTQSVSTTASNWEKQLQISHFKLGRGLGAGKFGQVFIAQHIKSGFVCAIKKIHKNGLDDTLKNQLIREIKIQMFLNHPNIVKLYTFFSDKEFIYLVMELCISGQLYDFIRKQKYLEEDLVRVIIRQISQGLDYIHENQIIHRDLKPENILYQNGMMKICDFGWSIDTKLMRQTFCGTPLYVSPELLKKKYYDNKVDIWGLGIMTYELLLGKVPFEIFNESDFRKIISDDIKFSKFIHISSQAKDFIEGCLQKQPQQRMTSSELLLHPFLQQVEGITNFSEIF